MVECPADSGLRPVREFSQFHQGPTLLVFGDYEGDKRFPLLRRLPDGCGAPELR